MPIRLILESQRKEKNNFISVEGIEINEDNFITTFTKINNPYELILSKNI